MSQEIPPTTPTIQEEIIRSEKDFVPTLLLAILLGWMGIHRFYVGKIGTGILMLITFGGFGVWSFIDVIMIIVGAFKDKQGFPVKPA